MTSQLIVAVFGSVDTARRAANDFDALSEKSEGFHIENGVVVEKDANGELAVLDAESRPFKGGAIGAIAGGLLGLLAGPLGVVTGIAAGAGAGLLAQAAGNALLDGTFVETVAARLVPGSVAVILEAKEDTPFSVDNVVAGFGGKVFRHALD
ncbi:UNVERIFIED_ORG: putative membrane protein [Burkholderia territorii]